MITFTGDERRLENYHTTKKELSDLVMFDAINAVEHYDKYKKQALEENICNEAYITELETKKNAARGKYGKLGCNMSHMLLLREIVKQYQEEDLWFLILEDDIMVREGFCDFIRNLIEDLNGVDTDYVRLYSDPRVASSQFSEKLKIKHNIYHMVKQWYTLAQLISVKGAKKILSKLPMNAPGYDFFVSTHANYLNATTVKTDLIENLGAKHSNDKKSKLGSLIWFG